MFVSNIVAGGTLRRILHDLSSMSGESLLSWAGLHAIADVTQSAITSGPSVSATLAKLWNMDKLKRETGAVKHREEIGGALRIVLANHVPIVLQVI
jgi:hypothetical protein